MICVDNLDTGSLLNVEHFHDERLVFFERFVFLNHDLTERLFLDEPVDVVFHLASPASLIRLPAPPLAHAQGMFLRDTSNARPRPAARLQLRRQGCFPRLGHGQDGPDHPLVHGTTTDVDTITVTP